MKMILENITPIEWDGRPGVRYCVRRPNSITAIASLDERLSTFPLVVFRPVHRDPRTTPVVLGLQGMAAPMTWNAFLVPTLLDMGVACAFFDTPFSGERSTIRDETGDVVRQLLPHSSRLTFDIPILERLFEAVALDLLAVRRLLIDRYQLESERVALFGVSLGCLLSSFAFTKHGFGERLLGVIGHPWLRRFATSYLPRGSSLLTSLPVRWLSSLLRWWSSYPWVALRFLKVLRSLAHGRGASFDPMTYLDTVREPRRVRLLLGGEDELVRFDDAEEAASRCGDGQAFCVPGLGHGQVTFGPSFEEHVRFFVQTQLGDWSH